MTSPSLASPAGTAWQRFSAGFLRAFHAYANWLVGLSWWRFLLLALLLLIVASIAQELPPFSWKISETVSYEQPKKPRAPKPPKAPKAPAAPQVPAAPQAASAAARKPLVHIETTRDGRSDDVEISIGADGVRIRRKPLPASAAGAGASTPAAAASGAASGTVTGAGGTPLADHAESAASAALAALDRAEAKAAEAPAPVAQAVREAVRQAREEIDDAVRQAREEAEAAAEEARAAAEEAEAAIVVEEGPRRRVRTVRLGDALPELALLWIFSSMIIKITYKRQIAAEAQAAQAVETAEAESLKRQVVEARMAAMQAQVEPHFLFNTLASIDHLIETDPARASQMQKNLIALLRASMPTMREASGNGGAGNGLRDLARELAVIRPYLEILKVRMEERLDTEISVPEGLQSAEFPPMMIQTLVENAIKHGLEPKPEGGRLRVSAEIVHGKLAVTVADTGLGFGKAATAGTGVGLANIRERLALLYGPQATLTITENPGGGTAVTIAVPYRPVQGASA
jgi:signal transduction histidine kinase